MSDGKIRVAEIIGKWVGGGVEQVVYNYASRIDKDKFQIDFFIDEDSLFIPEEKLKNAGINIIIVPPYQKVFRNQKELIRIFKEKNYDIVHSHENTLSVFPLRAAKKAGIKVRIAHSHSTTNPKEKKKNLLKLSLRPFSKIYATHYFACTEHAGRWLFGQSEIEKGNVYILNNAIEVEKFKYNEEVRKAKRAQLGIDDNTIVIGHIGRFVAQKNHDFLIEIFNDVRKQNKNAKLILIGKGPLEELINEKVERYGLNDSVMFLGLRNDDIPELYQAMDIFVFPSLYEGLGMVVIEAQCSGLPCVVSTEVPRIAKINDSVEFIELNNATDNWINVINKFVKIERRNSIDKLRENGYDIQNEVIKLEKEYINMVKKS